MLYFNKCYLNYLPVHCSYLNCLFVVYKYIVHVLAFSVQTKQFYLVSKESFYIFIDLHTEMCKHFILVHPKIFDTNVSGN